MHMQLCPLRVNGNPFLRAGSPPADPPLTGWKFGSILVANTADWAGMAWKRSSVRSRSGPPINLSLTETCRHFDFPATPARVRRALKFLHLQRQHQFNDFLARSALLLIDRVGVDIKRRAAARIPYQFLCGLDVHAERSQVGCKGMTKTVQANVSSDNSDPRQCETNALLKDAVRTEGFIPFELN